MRWTVLALLVTSLFFLGSSDKASSQDWDDEFVDAPTIRSLDDKSFEHETQAATGQTTGSWLILFTSSGCEACGEVESSLLEVMPKLSGGLPIIAKVNLSESPWTAKRFEVHKIPHLKLFRDRHMFPYGAHGEWSAASIISFIENGWNDVDRDVVPKELTYAGELQQKLFAFYKAALKYLGNRPAILAAVGSMTAMVGYLFAKHFIIKKHRHRKPRGRLGKPGKPGKHGKPGKRAD